MAFRKGFSSSFNQGMAAGSDLVKMRLKSQLDEESEVRKEDRLLKRRSDQIMNQLRATNDFSKLSEDTVGNLQKYVSSGGDDPTVINTIFAKDTQDRLSSKLANIRNVQQRVRPDLKPSNLGDSEQRTLESLNKTLGSDNQALLSSMQAERDLALTETDLAQSKELLTDVSSFSQEELNAGELAIRQMMKQNQGFLGFGEKQFGSGTEEVGLFQTLLDNLTPAIGTVNQGVSTPEDRNFVVRFNRLSAGGKGKGGKIDYKPLAEGMTAAQFNIFRELSKLSEKAALKALGIKKSQLVKTPRVERTFTNPFTKNITTLGN